MHNISIINPKRDLRKQTNWEALFPYYAGFPESFAASILESFDNQVGLVFDPWNGSGTTTYAASRLGIPAIGYDINPAMIVVSKARMLPVVDLDSIYPLLKKIIKEAHQNIKLEVDEPLLQWFSPISASIIRSLERSIRTNLIGNLTITTQGICWDNLSSIAATFYVGLFNICRGLISPFRSSNPTWIRVAKPSDTKIEIQRDAIENLLTEFISRVIHVLYDRKTIEIDQHTPIRLDVVDSTEQSPQSMSVDLVLTSPPYCTRIDYATATRIELAILMPLYSIDTVTLSRKMLGSVRVPQKDVAMRDDWGKICIQFLEQVGSHKSKASNSYYLRTHLDYFSKLAASLDQIRSSLKDRGQAIFVVQDSYYKDIHNNLAGILTEMAELRGYALYRREDFPVARNMARINPRSGLYRQKPEAVETVLCFNAV